MRKYRLALIIVFVLSACLWAASASANSWGLSGKLLQPVMKDGRWDDYTLTGNESGPFAVLSSRYHNALFYMDDEGELHVYTAAVWQPDDHRGAPALEWDGMYLSIYYGEDEFYTFLDLDGTGEYLLNQAIIGDFYVYANEEVDLAEYYFEADLYDDAAFWPGKISLADFNIRLFPRSVDEVRARNLMGAQLASGLQCLGSVPETGDYYSPDYPGFLLQPGKKGTAPVYSAPFGKSAWRSGKGKAAVGLNGDMWILSYYKNDDGESYACIRYDVSERTQRIGYALCGDLGLPEITDWNPDEPLTGFAHVDVVAVTDTFLTDDPDISQYPQFTVPRGTQFSCMGLYNMDYAYVEAEVRDDRFVDGGAIVWGFIPVRDLAPMPADTASEAMERLVGYWKYDAGGGMAGDYLVFNDDGTFTEGILEWVPENMLCEADLSGTWSVEVNNPARNLYWNRPPYQLTLIHDSGRVAIFGLDFDDTGFTLTDEEGGGGYVPAAEEEVTVDGYHG